LLADRDDPAQLVKEVEDEDDLFLLGFGLGFHNPGQREAFAVRVQIERSRLASLGMRASDQSRGFGAE
jgi:hypothetical protein